MISHRLALAGLGALVLLAVAPEASGGGGVAITSCNTVVTEKAYLAQDLYCPGTDGVVVGASGITIDLKGFTLRGDQSAGHNGIEDGVGYDSVSVKNGVIRNFESGVLASSADSVSVSKLVVTGSSSSGIRIIGDSAKIESTASGNAGAGVYITGNSAQVKSTLADGNASSGILVIGDEAQVKSSTASGNRGKGIQIGGNGAKVTSSDASGNVDHGIHVQGDAAQIKSNDADGNGFDAGVSNLGGLGINATAYTTPPTGTNNAGGNDDVNNCVPASLC